MTHVDESPWHADPWDDPDATGGIAVEPSRRSFRPVKWVVWVALLVGLAAIVSTGLTWYRLTERLNPAGDPGPYENFTVLADDTLATVAARLEEQRLVSDAATFEWYVDWKGGLELTPGYYRIRPLDHMGNVMAALGTPPEQTFTNVTFPEGYTLDRMAERLEERVPRLRASAFGAAASDGTVRSKYQPDGVDSLEGMLFPDTYQVSNGESIRQVLQRMVSLMERVGAQEDLELGAARLGLTPYQVLIVASLIEREARVEEDRPKIARVIYNRLAMDMLLQIDASLYYQQDESLDFGALKEIDSPYNTYLYKGLPPTPITNPGRASIAAALNPAPNPSLGDPLCVDLDDDVPCVYLFYVLIDDDGRHAFAATLEQHEANIVIAREKGLL
ncbi:MAG: endolytic transglycosylase MltG [Ilumatobacteraceae bacterium]